MLIRAFEIEIDRRRDLRARGADAVERQARIRPDIHYILDLVVVGGLSTEQLRRVEREPGLDAALLDARCGRLNEFRCARMQRACDLVHEQRDRHAPDALPRDAPVRAIGDHAGDALLAPSGRPGHFRDVAQGAGA